MLGRIQVSEQAAQILARHGQFEVECRGPIEVKGKGRLTTYLVVTPYDSPAEELDWVPSASRSGSTRPAELEPAGEETGQTDLVAAEDDEDLDVDVAEDMYAGWHDGDGGGEETQSDGPPAEAEAEAEEQEQKQEQETEVSELAGGKEGELAAS